MKAFENWVNKKPDSWDGQRKDIERVAWNAALRWVLTQRGYPAFGKDIDSDIIKKELDGE